MFQKAWIVPGSMGRRKMARNQVKECRKADLLLL
jgi:hypothetical protein